MTVEDFILLCRVRGFNFTANWVEKRYRYLLKVISDEMKEHLKRRQKS